MSPARARGSAGEKERAAKGSAKATSTKKAKNKSKKNNPAQRGNSAVSSGHPVGKGFARLRPGDRFEIALAVQATALDGELVILDPLTNQGFRANRTATQIWSGVGLHKTIEDISREMSEQHGLPLKYAQELTESLIEDMREKGLVAIKASAD